MSLRFLRGVSGRCAQSGSISKSTGRQLHTSTGTRIERFNRSNGTQLHESTHKRSLLSGCLIKRGQAFFSSNSIGRQQSVPSPEQSQPRVDLTQHLPMLLRDLCQCSACVDSSTNQKFFSSSEIPTDIAIRAVNETETGLDVFWQSDISGYDDNHSTHLSYDLLSNYASYGTPTSPTALGQQVCWSAQDFDKVQDIDYESYMHDDATLRTALQQLRSHGLVFLTGVPESEKSVSMLGERIGAIKNTFYGYTWDVRSVPQAKNVAYTSQDLGFHMDLLYMKQPPHLQLLHCIRSSSTGGASLFTDSYKAAADLFAESRETFDTLAEVDVDFHYNHPSSHLYHHNRPVFEMADSWKDPNTSALERKNPDIVSQLKAVSWSPPFQAPFQMHREAPNTGPNSLNSRIKRWHSAAQRFSSLVHRKEDIYERLMKPGECVIFDNRRVLHARTAFEVSDMGKERWLRGTYLDEDPYLSKLQVLGKKLASGS